MVDQHTSPTAEIFRLHTKPLRASDDTHVLIAEANHRIANNLSAVIGLVRMEAAAVGAKESMKGSEVRLLLEEIASRIDAVGALHKMLALRPLQEWIDMGEYLAQVCAPLTSSLFGSRQLGLIQNFAPGCLVSRENVVSLALIVNELVTNASKYAHPAGIPGKVSVTCRRDARGGLLLEVADDGVGLPEGFDPQTDGNVGLGLVRMLCSQMDAKLAFDTSSLGLRVQMVIPPSSH